MLLSRVCADFRTKLLYEKPLAACPPMGYAVVGSQYLWQHHDVCLDAQTNESVCNCGKIKTLYHWHWQPAKCCNYMTQSCGALNKW